MGIFHRYEKTLSVKNKQLSCLRPFHIRYLRQLESRLSTEGLEVAKAHGGYTWRTQKQRVFFSQIDYPQGRHVKRNPGHMCFKQLTKHGNGNLYGCDIHNPKGTERERLSQVGHSHAGQTSCHRYIKGQLLQSIAISMRDVA